MCFSGWRLACQQTSGPSCSCCRGINQLFHLPTAHWCSAHPVHPPGMLFLTPLKCCHQSRHLKSRNRTAKQPFCCVFFFPHFCNFPQNTVKHHIWCLVTAIKRQKWNKNITEQCCSSCLWKRLLLGIQKDTVYTKFL